MKSWLRRFPRQLLRFTPSGIMKWLAVAAHGKQMAISGECLMCGNCCRRICLTGGNFWIRSEKEYRKCLKKYPEYEWFRPLGRSWPGVLVFECTKLGEDGLCGDYENRPGFCREYPHTDIFFMGAELPEKCGYKFVVVPDFKKMLHHESVKPTDRQFDLDSGGDEPPAE
jgi:uncharacterized protein